MAFAPGRGSSGTGDPRRILECANNKIHARRRVVAFHEHDERLEHARRDAGAVERLQSRERVALTGQVHSSLIGSDAFQEADTFGLTRSCTKHNFMVKNVTELPQIVHEAFYIASSGRPGEKGRLTRTSSPAPGALP